MKGIQEQSQGKLFYTNSNLEKRAERLDWLCFLGYDFDSNIRDHSVLSKARARWDVEVFKIFSEHIVFQCVQTGLVDGRKIFMDSSLIDADASNNSVIDMKALIDQHNAVTEKKADTIVADSKYGTIDNFLACHDRGVQAHMPDLGKAVKKRNRKTNIFTEDHFRYDPDQEEVLNNGD